MHRHQCTDNVVLTAAQHKLLSHTEGNNQQHQSKGEIVVSKMDPQLDKQGQRRLVCSDSGCTAWKLNQLYAAGFDGHPEWNSEHNNLRSRQPYAETYLNRRGAATAAGLG